MFIVRFLTNFVKNLTRTRAETITGGEGKVDASTLARACSGATRTPFSARVGAWWFPVKATEKRSHIMEKPAHVVVPKTDSANKAHTRNFFHFSALSKPALLENCATWPNSGKLTWPDPGRAAAGWCCAFYATQQGNK